MKLIGILMEAIANPNQNLTMRCEIFPKSTSELGAEKFGVSPATIERDAQYKRAVDAIASVGGVQLRTLLLSGEIEAKYLPQSSSTASNAREPIATSPVVEVIELPFLPPTLNEIIDTAKSDKYAATKEKRRWTNEVADACQGKHQFSGQVSIDYHWRVKNTKRDPNNISAGTKFIDDGLVAAKVITDDSLEVIVSVFPRYEKAERDSVRLTITEVK